MLARACVLCCAHQSSLPPFCHPQFLVARELFRIAYVAEKSKRSLPLLRTQQWYFFFTAVFWLYLRCQAGPFRRRRGWGPWQQSAGALVPGMCRWHLVSYSDA